ncbi:hypothetical protein Q5O14_11250 [Eubacteriaceae bacterium ES2]|nr:hypothetical protein Q5O14_11250 [Eubacteriaceae bacterium ES2]
MKNLIYYHFKLYFKSNRLLIPFLVYLIYLFSAYSIMPYSIVSSFSESAMVLFFIMVYVGFSYSELENPVAEQLVLLKIRNENLYYVSRLTVLLIVGTILSIIGILYPLLGNVYNHGQLFTRSLMFYDILFGIFLHLTMGSLGAFTGSFFHPRIIKNRKLAILMAFFTAVCAVLKGTIIKNILLGSLITWIFPPVYDVLVIFSGCEFFSFQAIALPFLWSLIYGIALGMFQIYLLKKNKF